MPDAQGAYVPPQSAGDTEARIVAIIAYVLFIGVFAAGLGAIAGVVLAYIKRGEVRGTIWESHFNNLIQVFWIGVVIFAAFMAVALTAAFNVWHVIDVDQFPGALFVFPALYVASMIYLVWYLYRVIKGLMRALESKPYA